MAGRGYTLVLPLADIPPQATSSAGSKGTTGLQGSHSRLIRGVGPTSPKDPAVDDLYDQAGGGQVPFQRGIPVRGLNGVQAAQLQGAKVVDARGLPLPQGLLDQAVHRSG